jgi:hypothetical protein
MELVLSDFSLQICLPIGLVSVGFIAFLSLAIIVQVGYQKAIQRRLEVIRAENPSIEIFNDWQLRYTLQKIDHSRRNTGKGIIGITPTALIIYDRSRAVSEKFRWSLEPLQWFGRPQKYHNGVNEIWLHLENSAEWIVLKLRMSRGQMQLFVRALKQAAPPELVTAYRRRRPYIHVGPMKASPATQDIYGAWTLSDPIRLYLMPRFLVLVDDARVLRKISLENIQQIGALWRLDAPGAQGLVRFRAEGETFAFAINDHESFAASLAEAAKRTLEAPVERKQKGKGDDEDE